MQFRKVFRQSISFLVISILTLSLAVVPGYGLDASHIFGNGAGGADYCTTYNYVYGQNTIFGPNVSNHKLIYNGALHDAFCLNPYLTPASAYTQGSFYGPAYAADYNMAVKYAAMFYAGYPAGYSDDVRKIAAQLAIFDTSQMGIDYAPPYKKNHWYVVMFNGSSYYYALMSLMQSAYYFTIPDTTAVLGTPDNITNVYLTYNSSNNRFEASVNAGPNASYYSWSGYASRSGNTIKFSVPAADVANWTSTYNGYPSYTSGPITGYGPSKSVLSPKVWSAGYSYQQMLTLDYEMVIPTNTITYSLYCQGMDEGVPGGGGGLYGGRISGTSPNAGGGSGFIGSSASSGSTISGSSAPLPPDNSSNGYVRVTLLN